MTVLQRRKSRRRLQSNLDMNNMGNFSTFMYISVCETCSISGMRMEIVNIKFPGKNWFKTVFLHPKMCVIVLRWVHILMSCALQQSK